jgi:hypothetical protein
MFNVLSGHLLSPKSFKMPMTWNADVDAKVSLNCLYQGRGQRHISPSYSWFLTRLLTIPNAAVLKTCNVKLDYQALAAKMGKGKFLYPFSRTSIDTDFWLECILKAIISPSESSIFAPVPLEKMLLRPMAIPPLQLPSKDARLHSVLRFPKTPKSAALCYSYQLSLAAMYFSEDVPIARELGDAGAS